MADWEGDVPPTRPPYKPPPTTVKPPPTKPPTKKPPTKPPTKKPPTSPYKPPSRPPDWGRPSPRPSPRPTPVAPYRPYMPLPSLKPARTLGPLVRLTGQTGRTSPVVNRLASRFLPASLRFLNERLRAAQDEEERRRRAAQGDAARYQGQANAYQRPSGGKKVLSSYPSGGGGIPLTISGGDQNNFLSFPPSTNIGGTVGTGTQDINTPIRLIPPTIYYPYLPGGREPAPPSVGPFNPIPYQPEQPQRLIPDIGYSPTYPGDVGVGPIIPPSVPTYPIKAPAPGQRDWQQAEIQRQVINTLQGERDTANMRMAPIPGTQEEALNYEYTPIPTGYAYPNERYPANQTGMYQDEYGNIVQGPVHAFGPDYNPIEDFASNFYANNTDAGDTGAGTGGKKKKKGGGGSSYYPKKYYGSSGYSRSYGSSYGGGGGGTNNDFAQYGITPEFMEQYKAFWGQDYPEKHWPIFQHAMELFARHLGRMPQMDDWQAMWAAMKNQPVPEGGTPRKNSFYDIAKWEPIVVGQMRQPQPIAPDISYGPGLSF